MPVVSPFLRNGPRASCMVVWTLAALMVPSTIYSILYRSPFIFQLIGYTLLGMAAETLYVWLLRKEKKINTTGSGLTAALIAASVPTSMPFWPMLFAILIALWVAKLPMTGKPLRFNAAMAGRLFLMLAYGNQIVAWGNPTVDGLSCATPQELYSSDGFTLDLPTLLFGRIGGIWEDLFHLVPGSPGETFPIIILLIGVVLYIKGISTWRTPVAFLVSFCITTALLGESALFNLLSSATIFSAAFIVSDPVSTPMSKSGKIICGIIIGASNAVIRHYTYYAEAIVYAVLIGNLASPLLDRIAFGLQGRKLRTRTTTP